jgi:hypothetical protein
LEKENSILKRLQNPEILGMAGRGSRGELAQADGSILEEGVHLRWQMAPELGFPSGGFDIYRRGENYGKFLRCGSFREIDLGGIAWVSYDPDYTDEGVAIVASGDTQIIKGCPPNEVPSASFPGEQEIRFDFAEPVRFVGFQFDADTPPKPVAEAYWSSNQGDVLLATRSAYRAGPLRLISLFANHIDYVVLRGEDMILCRLCFVFVSDGVKDGWSKDPLNGKTPIYLPITHPDWNSPHPHAPNDQKEAKVRLPAGLSSSKRDIYREGFREDLHDILYDLVGTKAQHMFRIKESDENSDASLDWPGMSLMQLLALDPNIARILGMYWHDEPPSAFKFHDYRVVAHYGDMPLPGVRIDFSDQTPGTRPGSIFQQEEVTIVSANPMDIVRATWEDSEHNALLFTRTIAAGPISINLPPSVQSVTLRLAADALFVVKYALKSLDLFVATQSAGEHTLQFDKQSTFDTILLFPVGEITLFEIVLRKNIGEIGDLAYDVYHLRSRTQSEVSVPTLEPPQVASTTTGLDENGELMQNQSGVALRWDRLEAGGVYLQAGAPMLYHVQREDLDTDGQTVLQSAILNEERPTLVSKRGSDDGDLNGDEGPHYADGSVPDGIYTYAVRGIDLFGVLGDWSAVQEVEVLDRLAPPPPQSVQALYLDPLDPRLSDEDRDWTDTNGAGLKLSWQWPGLFRMQAPDAVEPLAEFRVYSQKGVINGLVGNITGVTVNGTTSELRMDIQWQAATDALAGESIRLNESFFTIVGSGRGPNTVITVENLTAPEKVPEPGAFSITFSPDRYYTLDYGDASHWQERLHVAPVQDAPIISAGVVSIADYDEAAAETDDATVVARVGATRTVTLSAGLADPDKVLLPGVLFCEGTVYPVCGHTTGSALSLHVVPPTSSTEIGATIEPPVGVACKYYPGRQYEIRIPGYQLPIEPGHATVIAQIAMSCADGKAHTDDNPVWAQPDRGGLGSRPGNESVLSPMVKVTATLRTPPAAVANVPVAPDDPIFAKPADYYGQARYTLSWDTVPDVAGYVVYRCGGAALFDQDRRLRQEQKGHYQLDSETDSVFEDDPGFGDWLAEFDPDLTENDMTSNVDGHLDAWRAWAKRFYTQLTDTKIQDLANLEGNEEAFRRINTQALEETRLNDQFDGRGRGIYLYRVRTIDASGNESDWQQSTTFPPVHIFDVTPPATPKIASVLAEEKSITMTWRANREEDLKEYWIWREETKEALSDVRRLPIYTTILPMPDASLEIFQDIDLYGGIEYFYRIAAVDDNENISLPTEVLHTRIPDTTPPDPPAWERVEWVRIDTDGMAYDYDDLLAAAFDPAISLQWLAQESNLIALLERRNIGSEWWAPLTDWIEPQDASNPDDEAARRFSWIDKTAIPSQGYEYRVNLVDPAGNVNRAFEINEVDAPQ